MCRIQLHLIAGVALVLASGEVADISADILEGAQADVAPPKANRGTPARQRFQESRSYYAYYGANKVAELSHYDVAIMHAPQMASENVKQLSALGVVTVGYVAIGEDSRLRKGNGQGPGAKASWYFDRDRDGRADRDPVWKSWYANAGDAKWRANRVAEANRLVVDYGFDGVFLDLISVSEIYPESRKGMVQMIRELRTALPNAVIVMNQGFDIVADVAPLIDGFMMESFTASYDFASRRYLLNPPSALDFHLGRATKLLNPAIQDHDVRVLVLDYADRSHRNVMQIAANRAASLGYLFAVAPIQLDDVYTNIPSGDSDPKWLQRRATPEQLSLTLHQSSNGFPKGTAITPSGCYAGYSVDPIVDAATDRSRPHWSKSSWASSEDGDAAWLKFTLPNARRGGRLAIDWHDAAGPSRAFKIQVRHDAESPWRDVETATNNDARRSVHQLPATEYKEMRVFQYPNGGSVERPRLMWIARVELIDE